MSCITLTLLLVQQPAMQAPLPIIDMHLHAHSLEDYGGGMPVCTNEQGVVFPGMDPRTPITLERTLKAGSGPITPPSSDQAVTEESLTLLRRYNIFAVTTGG
jgi:uncharacterized protein